MPTLHGQWLSTYSGWMHFEPTAMPKPDGSDDIATFIARVNALPPLFGGYRCKPRWVPSWSWWPFQQNPYDQRLPDAFELREGYFAIAGLACLNFDGVGNVTGLFGFNRGGYKYLEKPLTGTYAASLHPQLGVVLGTYNTIHVNEGSQRIQNDYRFAVRSDDELDWMWTASHVVGEQAEPNYRGLVTHGTLRRVTSTMRDM